MKNTFNTIGKYVEIIAHYTLYTSEKHNGSEVQISREYLGTVSGLIDALKDHPINRIKIIYWHGAGDLELLGKTIKKGEKLGIPYETIGSMY